VILKVTNGWKMTVVVKRITVQVCLLESQHLTNHIIRQVSINAQKDSRFSNESNLKSFQKALIGWKKAGPPKKPLLF